MKPAFIAPFLLAGCSTVYVPAKVPEPPAHLVRCAAEAAIEIPAGPLTRAQTAELVARLRLSELAGKECAAGWAAYYARLRGAE